MHPDMPVLLFGALAAIVIGKIEQENSDKWHWYVLLIVLMLCSGIFKQNSVMIFLGFGVTILFSKSVDRKKKLKLLGSILAAGILVLFVIFGIDGCFEMTVLVMSRHESVSQEVFNGYIVESLKWNRIFVILFLTFLIFLITKNIELTFVQRMWLITGFVWTAFNIYGTKKVGSNAGNVDVALIVLAPFVGMVVQEIYYKIKVHIKFDSGFLSEWKKLPILIAGIYIVCISYMIEWAKTTCSVIEQDREQYLSRKADERTVTAWLNDNYLGGR